MSKPIFVVFGATGAQGGAVVRSLLRNGKYHIRGLTRNVESEAAKKLKAQGVELVKGDMHNREDLKQVFKGAEVAFVLTNFWDPSSMGKEYEIGKVIVDEAIAAGVKHFIWSTLPPAEKVSNGKYKVPHFDDKAKVDEYIKSKGLPASFIEPGFYYQNFKTFFPPKKEEDGTYVLSLPATSSITAVDIEDIGDAVVYMEEHRNEFLGKYVPFYGSHMSPQEYVDQLSAYTGQKVKLNLIPRDVYAKFNFPGAHELAEMFGWFDEFTYHGPGADLEIRKKVNPNVKTWQQYLEASKFTL